MKKSRSKIMGIAAAIAVIVYWGNTIFGGKYSSSSKKKSSQSTYLTLKCTDDNGDLTWGTTISKKGFTWGNRVGDNADIGTNMITLGPTYGVHGGKKQKELIVINRNTGRFDFHIGDTFTVSGNCSSKTENKF